MNLLALNEIFRYPNDTGVIHFVLGIFFILSIYHLLLFFQNKDKTYLFYSLYTFFVFANHLPQASMGFTAMLIPKYFGVNAYYSNILMWAYNLMYFVFIFTFTEIKTFSKKWYSFIFNSIYVVTAIMVFVIIASLITKNIQYLVVSDGFFVLFFLLFGIACYIPIIKYKVPLKRYIIAGSTMLFISSLIAYYFHYFEYFKAGEGYSIFYIGVVVENLIFSLALGYKQKMILQTKNEAQEQLIKQLEENDKLKQVLHVQLEKDIESYSLQAEEARIEHLKAKYDKEIAELKMASLRNQMNPHFIFNSLNAIKLYIIDNNKEKAIYYLNKFSKLIRKILSATREKVTLLVEEIETTKLYLNIENIRFENQIQTSFYIDPSLSINTIKIPSLLLQPFVENAIWHGLSPKKGAKKFEIRFEKEHNTHLKITITDNGIGRKKANHIKNKKIHKRESVGIKITEERLRNFCKEYEKHCSIKFTDLLENGQPTGTAVTLHIPLI